jgi:hypothetical protein
MIEDPEREERRKRKRKENKNDRKIYFEVVTIISIIAQRKTYTESLSPPNILEYSKVVSLIQCCYLAVLCCDLTLLLNYIHHCG